ncbi:nonribosomal peptide synthase [Colletotrichum musicola]|uniref:Nonribosomal peptide synthase n=1 Tax=Colletotrichum musicola TaxID=2175873 RepID=A0A8H6JPF1_9PEZI|nr:nonribosomal peptide synthase [Colletotrichum musicola]
MMDSADPEGEMVMDLVSCAALVLATPPGKIDLLASFVVNGGDSLKAILLQSMMRSRGHAVTREDLLTKPTIGDIVKDACRPRLRDVDTSWASASSSVTSHPATCSPEPASSTAGSSVSVPVSECAGASQNPEADVRVVEGAGGGPSHGGEHGSAVPIPGSIKQSEPPQRPCDLLTELQLSLAHETITHCGSNIITYVETHHPENAETYRQAWMQVLMDEAIFGQSCLGPLFSNESRTSISASRTGPDHERSAGLHINSEEWPGWTLDLGRVEKPADGDDGPALMEITAKIHHALIDAYSLHALVHKVRARANGMTTKPGTSFWDWARLLRRHQEENKPDGDRFWAEKIEKHADAKGCFVLPEPARDLRLEARQVERMHFAVDPAAIDTRARSLGVTSAAIFYAAWTLVVATYTDSDSIVFGSVLSGRGLDVPGSLDAIGPVINVLPLHVAVRRGATLREFIWGLFVDTVTLEGLTWTSTDNGFRRDYESALSVEMQLSEVPAAGSGAYPAMPIGHSASQHSRVPISVTVKDASLVTIDMHSSRYRPRDAQLVADCYERALDTVLTTTADAKVHDAMQGLLSCPSYSQLMRWGNGITGLTTRASVKDDDLVTLFGAAASVNRDGVALEKGDRTMTYAELQARSDVICDTLASVVTPGDVVCVHSDRSMDWICAIWGVLKAGCTYCSLDPQLPASYRESMVNAVSAKAFVTATTEQLGAWRPRSVGLAFSVESVSCRAPRDASTMVRTPGLAPDLAPAAPRTPRPRSWPRPHQPAYICFTSGSTGAPKPVVCTHAGLVAFQRDPTVRLMAKPGVRISQVMSVAFDGSIHEIFSALTYGATLVLPSTSQDVLSVLTRVDSAVLTPSIARALHPADFPGLQTVYLVGEPVPQAVADVWTACKDVYNMYGPTEATCGATIKRLRHGEAVTIGRPNPSTRIYVLNSSGGLSQPGMVGRIHLAGVQVSRGYHGMSDQTDAVFRPDDIMGNGEMSYDTGDMGYWDERGELVCVGRRDRQMKLRGYRVDLNDLEIRIVRAVPEADAVVVTVRRGLVDELLAMLQPAGLDVTEIRSRLEDSLPRYLIPGHIIAADNIPTTPAGKVDYKAIAAIDVSTRAGAGAETNPDPNPDMTPDQAESDPVTDTEETVALAYSAVLPRTAARRPIHRDQSFGELGGHSMDQIKLARHLAQALGIPVPLRMVICNPSIKALASAIDQARGAFPLATAPAKSRANATAPDRVAPIEADWLEKYRVQDGTWCFNVSSLHRFEPDQVDVNRLEKTLNSVLRRHPVLRSTYQSDGSRRKPEHCRVLTPHSPRVQRLRVLDVWSELNRPFVFDQLQQEHPVRVLLTDDTFLVVMSHIVADYTALATVLREASALYLRQELPVLSADDGEAYTYPPRQLCGMDLAEDLKEYWLSTLADLPKPPGILSSAPRRTSYRGRSVVFEFEEAISRQILACRLSQSVSLQHVAMAAVALGLVTGEQQKAGTHVDVVMGVPHINRSTAEQMDMVGLFLQPLPVRIRHDGDTSGNKPASLLREVQQSTQAALARGIPWHQLLDLARCTPDYPDHPLFDVMVSFHEPEMVQQLRMDIPTLEPCFAWSSGAKFKVMCEFTAVADDCVLLRVEYDDGCIHQEEDLRRFIRDVAAAMATLTSNPESMSSSVSDAQGQVTSPQFQRHGHHWGMFWDERALLGKRMSDWPLRNACTWKADGTNEIDRSTQDP